MTRLESKPSEEYRWEVYWNQCVKNMYNKIKENNLTDQFLSLDIKNSEIFFNDYPSVLIKIDNLTHLDGHSGCSFICCCKSVYKTLSDEKIKEKMRLNAQFRGIIKAIIKLKKLRLKASEKIYSPDGIGYVTARNHFYMNL